jgi:hypothetical protein
MTSRFFTIGAACIALSTAAALAVSSFPHSHLRAAIMPGSARLHAFGSRGALQSASTGGAKFDGALADLTRHAGQARPDHVLADLRAMAPGARFRSSASGAPLVLVDAVTRGDPLELEAALESLGLERSAVFANDVSGWMPVLELDAATLRPEVHAIRAALSRTRAGAVTSQGDFVQHSDTLRSANALSGAGVTVGVLSDSFDCYSVFQADGVAASGNAGYASNGFLATAETDVSTGDLPSGVKVLEEAPCMDGNEYNGYPDELPFGDEGRAMLQVVHDVAPGASLAFYTAENGEADFANGIVALAKSGAKVIADDVGYYDEPFYQDGLVAQAVDEVNGSPYGVAYFSAAGNDGSLAYENTTPGFSTVSSSQPNVGEHLLNFDATGATTVTSLPVTIAALIPGEYVAIVVEWDQPYVTGSPNSGGATSRIDVCITGAGGNDQIVDENGNPVSCTGANAAGSDPVQIIMIGIPATSSGNSSPETLSIQVGLVSGTTPGRIKVAVEDDGAGSTINAFPSASATATVQGHPAAVGAAAVGAAFYFQSPACGTSPAALESYSSLGGAPILFDTSGARLMTPVMRNKPDFVDADGVNNTFLGFTLAQAGATGSNGLLSTNISACQNEPKYPNFFGTSAATPHAAAVAALMLQANSAVTPAQIYQALRTSALAMGSPTPNFESGYGFVQADAAFALLPQVAPPQPTLTLSSTNIATGSAATLTWSAPDATACTASGSWSGSEANSGTQSVSPSAVGTDTYTLTCSNSAGASPAASATLTVTAASNAAATGGGGGGGGGALDPWLLLGLAGVVCGGFAARRERHVEAQ